MIAGIDGNGDGVFSEAEQRAYAGRVLEQLAMTVDGEAEKLRLLSVSFPSIEFVKEGMGEIDIEFEAVIPAGTGNRTLKLENHEPEQKAVYLVNTLVPRDPAIQIVGQRRNQDQSVYELDFIQAGAAAKADGRWLRVSEWAGAASFANLFKMGMRHIAEGTDHLLFLLTLLLPAPLVVTARRWSGVAGVRQSLLRILRIVTAFTVGHSVTLALAALGWVRVPSAPVEVLIAVSILVSAVHALRPVFPGKEAGIAAFFGLIHGLAFAATLNELGLGRWERVAGILEFNLGIETMQLVVVVAVLPSLVLLSRTRIYPVVRVGGAMFAGVAAVGWIGERMFGLRNPAEGAVNFVAAQSVWVAASLLVMSLSSWTVSVVGARRAVAA